MSDYNAETGGTPTVTATLLTTGNPTVSALHAFEPRLRHHDRRRPGDDRRTSTATPVPYGTPNACANAGASGAQLAARRQRFPSDDNDDGRRPGTIHHDDRCTHDHDDRCAHHHDTTAPVANGVTATPTTNTYGGYGGQDIVTLSNTKAITALTVTINVARTTGVTTNGGYNSFPGGVGSAAWSTGSGFYHLHLHPDLGHHPRSVLERAGRCSIRRNGIAAGDVGGHLERCQHLERRHIDHQRNLLGLAGSDDALSGQLVDLLGRVTQFGSTCSVCSPSSGGGRRDPGRTPSRLSGVPMRRRSGMSGRGRGTSIPRAARWSSSTKSATERTGHTEPTGTAAGRATPRRPLEQAGLQEVVEGVPIGHSVGVLTVGRIGGKIREAQDVAEPREQVVIRCRDHQVAIGMSRTPHRGPGTALRSRGAGAPRPEPR